MLNRTSPLIVLAASALLVGCVGEPEPTGPPANVLLLTIDSTRTDRLRPFNPSATAQTPNIDALARSGTTFTNAWATSPWTAPSVVSVFTGLYPPSHGVVFRDDTTPAGMATMARIFDAQGYRLANFSFFSGLSYFRNLGLPPPPAELGHAHAARAFDQWVTPDDTFFAWIHLVEPHLPYGAPGYRARELTVTGSTGLEAAQLQGELPLDSAIFEDGDRERLLELYDRDLEHADAVIGRILETLARNGVREETVIVLVADHGEEILEHGWVGHASTAIQAKLVPEILRIPLVISGPGVDSGVMTDALVQQVDILPTLCTLLRLPLPENLDGIALPLAPVARRNTRDLAFFDSSAAGNLTPVERRSERLQGVTDGSCLVVRRSIQGEATSDRFSAVSTSAACIERQAAELGAALDRWQSSQGGKRLRLLEETSRDELPPAEVLDGFTGDLAVIHPSDGANLSWSHAAGQIVIEWAECGGEQWIQYTVGFGPATISGAFIADADPMVFGPFPPGFWNDLARHDPYRFRVLCPEHRRRSAWREFHLEKEAGD